MTRVTERRRDTAAVVNRDVPVPLETSKAAMPEKPIARGTAGWQNPQSPSDGTPLVTTGIAKGNVRVLADSSRVARGRQTVRPACDG